MSFTRNQPGRNFRSAKSAYPQQDYKRLDELQQPKKAHRKPNHAAITAGSQRIDVTNSGGYKYIEPKEPATLGPSIDGLLPSLYGIGIQENIQQPAQRNNAQRARQSQRARKSTAIAGRSMENSAATPASGASDSDSATPSLDISDSDSDSESDSGSNSSTSSDGSTTSAMESGDESDISIHTVQRSPSRTPKPEPELDKPAFIRKASRPPTKLTTALLDLFPFCNPLPEEYKFLPFLRRNVRKGFVKTCGGGPTSIPVSIDVTYVLPGTRELQWTGSITRYLCPLCTLFNGLFKDRDVLAGHLQRDHSEVSSQWKQKEEENSWELLITFPLPPKREPVSPAKLHQPVPLRAAESISDVMADVMVKVREESVSPRHLEFSLSVHNSIPIPPSNRPSHLSVTPPPIERPLGPSARTPFLPARPIETQNEGKETQYHGEPVYYSCRPEGPKIYDLLNTLPLGEFGVMQWEILEREEEIFECDEFTDEMKVMSALWNRWYWLKGNDTFRRNHFKGVLAFVNYYWKMIHRAAGWEALRNFLMLFQVYRLMTTAEVAKVLREYETMTQMSDWPTDDYEDPSEEMEQTDMEVEPEL